jgi:hypothetical protein
VVKVEIRALADFQAQWESPALGLFHEVPFSIARLPTDSAIEPYFPVVDLGSTQAAFAGLFANN